MVLPAGKTGPSETEIKRVYRFPLLGRSLLTAREEISAALWEWKPDCGGQKNEREVRERRWQTRTPFGRRLYGRQKEHPPPQRLPRLKRKLEKRMKEIWRLSKTFHRPSELFRKTSWGWHERQNSRCKVSKQSWCVCSQSTQPG